MGIFGIFPQHGDEADPDSLRGDVDALGVIPMQVVSHDAGPWVIVQALMTRGQHAAPQREHLVIAQRDVAVFAGSVWSSEHVPILGTVMLGLFQEALGFQ